MAAIKGIINDFIEYKIRGLDIKAVEKNQFWKVVTKEMEELFEEIDHKMQTFILEITDYVLANLDSSKEIYLFMQIFSYWGLIMDDYLEDNPSDAQKFVKYIQDRECPAKTLYEQILQIYFRVSKQLNDEEFLKQFNDIIIEWLEFLPKRKAFDSKNSNFTDEEFIDMRSMDVFAKPHLFIYTLDVGLRVTDEVLNNEDYIGINRELLKHIFLVNDLFSFVKEAENGQGDFNYIYFKMVNNGMTVQQSMDQIVAEIKETEVKVNEYKNKLISSNNEGLAKYSQNVTHVMNGNAYWSATTPRYKNREYKFYEIDFPDYV